MKNTKVSNVFLIEHTVENDYAYLQLISDIENSFKTKKLYKGTKISIIIDKKAGYNYKGKEKNNE